MNTLELEGDLLDRWVAKAEHDGPFITIRWPSLKPIRFCKPYSSDWDCAGPIIEREGICVFNYTDCWGAICTPGREDWIDVHRGDEDATGPTPLIAAMRAYVASKFGETVPDEVEA